MKYFKNYRPLTATPYQRSETYVEIEPCTALKPCIRCFWGSKDIYLQEAGAAKQSVVVSDTCMDVIFTFDYTNNRLYSGFCGVDDRAVFSSDSPVERQHLSIIPGWCVNWDRSCGRRWR